MTRSVFTLLFLTLAVYSCATESEHNSNYTRAARQWEIPRDVRFVNRLLLEQQQHTRRPTQILARSDHYPPPRAASGSVPGPYGGRPPFGRPPPPHLRRRVYSGPPGPPPPGVFLRPNGGLSHQQFKNTRFSLAKDPHNHKGLPMSYRPGPGQNPNAIPETHKFKPSPTYNGEVIVRRPTPGVQKSDERIETLRRFKQHPIPQDPNHRNTMYSVHEDTDSDADSSHAYHNIGETAMKQAKQYLNFMSSNEYFLPKIEPDYRKMDQSKQQHQQKKKSPDSAAFSSSSLQHYQQEQQKQQRNADSSSSLNTAFTVNAPLRVSSSYSQAQPQVQAQSNSVNSYSSSYPSQAIVGSYQNENKKSQHNSASTSFSSEDATNHNQHRQSSNSIFSSVLRPKTSDRASDPERVEFTERDAIHVSYTSNPMDSLSRNVEQKQNQQQTDRRYVRPATASLQQDELDDDDAEDADQEEELMQAASDVYGRTKVNPNEAAPSNPNTEQKDIEEYCERICSNVQDEDEEVVCGSDGFMYTSEAQMECYASCLHIDVTIQSKGSCNQPL